VSKQHEEWDILGRLGEKILAQASMFQELKLALVHREIQRMANDKSTTVSWTAEKRDKFKAAWKAANDAEQESFTFDENEYLVTYGRYLIEYLDNVFGEAA
jgi:hypothetical protein